MLKKRLKFHIINLAELEETIRFQLEASEHIEQTNWEESLETYLLHQVWSRISLKLGQMHRSHKLEGSMQFDQLQIDLIIKKIRPRNKTDGLLYAEFYRNISGRFKIIRHSKIQG